MESLDKLEIDYPDQRSRILAKRDSDERSKACGFGRQALGAWRYALCVLRHALPHFDHFLYNTSFGLNEEYSSSHFIWFDCSAIYIKDTI